MVFRYQEKHLAFLREGYKKMRVPELTAAFNRQFAAEQTRTSIKSVLSNHSITSGRKPGWKKGERFSLTPQQIEFVKKHYREMSLAELTAAVNREFSLQKTVQQLKSFTRNHRIRSGRSGCFTKGHRPWNKGSKGQGLTGRNKTSFTRGHVPANKKPLGFERICSKDGYILIKIEEQNPYTGHSTRYKAKHVVIWEAANGPVPKGHVLRFVDGNKLNCTLKNIELVSRAEHLRLTRIGYNDAPLEYKPVLKTIAKVEVQTFERKAGRE